MTKTETIEFIRYQWKPTNLSENITNTFPRGRHDWLLLRRLRQRLVVLVQSVWLETGESPGLGGVAALLGPQPAP